MGTHNHLYYRIVFLMWVTVESGPRLRPTPGSLDVFVHSDDPIPRSTARQLRQHELVKEASLLTLLR